MSDERIDNQGWDDSSSWIFANKPKTVEHMVKLRCHEPDDHEIHEGHEWYGVTMDTAIGTSSHVVRTTVIEWRWCDGYVS